MAVITVAITAIISASFVPTSRMLPNRKLNKSTEKPPDRLVSITPTARPDVSTTTTAASPGILALDRSFCSPRPPNIETKNAVHIGNTPTNSPREIPPNATCDIPSPKSEYRLNTKNVPIKEHTTAVAIPATRAFCINP